MGQHRTSLTARYLIALALLVRAIVPTGWMPEVEHGSIAIQPCPSSWALSRPAPVPAALSHHDTGHSMDDHDEHDRPSESENCPFGVVSSGSANLPVEAALPTVLGGYTHFHSALAEEAELRRERSPSLARAPPSFG